MSTHLNRPADRAIRAAQSVRRGDLALQRVADQDVHDRVHRGGCGSGTGRSRRACGSRNPAHPDTRYGVGFLGIHEGRSENVVFVDWWEKENELHHHVYLSSSGNPGAQAAAGIAGPIACT